MAERAFADGAVVRLKSGGPKMTVANYAKYGMGAERESYLCQWFEGSKVAENTFYEPQLELVDEAKPGATLRAVGSKPSSLV